MNDTPQGDGNNVIISRTKILKNYWNKNERYSARRRKLIFKCFINSRSYYIIRMNDTPQGDGNTYV